MYYCSPRRTKIKVSGGTQTAGGQGGTQTAGGQGGTQTAGGHGGTQTAGGQGGTQTAGGQGGEVKGLNGSPRASDETRRNLEMEDNGFEDFYQNSSQEFIFLVKDH